VSRRIEHLRFQIADLKALAIFEQVIEVATVGCQIGCVEDWTEDPLNVFDVLADANLGAGLGLDEGRTCLCPK
jgi:hypothetical protein